MSALFFRKDAYEPSDKSNGQYVLLGQERLQRSVSSRVEMTMGMGFPVGMGIGDKIGNGNGKEWETTCMGVGMAIIPMGINSHRRIQLCNSTVY